jgi:AraC-like DNA-binding protein
MFWINSISQVLGILFCSYFLYWTIKNKSLYLGVLFFVYLLILLKYLIPDLRTIYHSLDQLTWLIGPLVYFFVTKSDGEIKKKEIVHFLPFLIGFNIILFYKYISLDFFIVELLFSPILRSAQSIVYILLAALEVKNNKWMKWVILSISLLLTLTYVISFNILDAIFISSTMTYALFVVGYICVNFIKEKQQNIKKSEEKSLELEAIYKKVIEQISNNQLFLNRNLKLSDLSELLKINEKLISKSINTYSKENFNAFVNKFRVKYATTLIDSEKFSYYTIDAIAEEAGFANKVSFYKAFKRIENISPSKYREKYKIAANK